MNRNIVSQDDPYETVNRSPSRQVPIKVEPVTAPAKKEDAQDGTGVVKSMSPSSPPAVDTESVSASAAIMDPGHHPLARPQEVSPNPISSGNSTILSEDIARRKRPPSEAYDTPGYKRGMATHFGGLATTPTSLVPGPPSAGGPGTRHPLPPTPTTGPIHKDLSGTTQVTSALFVGDLQWWTTDETLRAVAIDATGLVDGGIREVGFFEHKANGKSRGLAYVSFTSTDSAVKTKSRLEETLVDKKRVSVNFSFDKSNPFRAMPKEGPLAVNSGGGHHNKRGSLMGVGAVGVGGPGQAPSLFGAGGGHYGNAVAGSGAGRFGMGMGIVGPGGAGAGQVNGYGMMGGAGAGGGGAGGPPRGPPLPGFGMVPVDEWGRATGPMSGPHGPPQSGHRGGPPPPLHYGMDPAAPGGTSGGSGMGVGVGGGGAAGGGGGGGGGGAPGAGYGMVQRHGGPPPAFRPGGPAAAGAVPMRANEGDSRGGPGPHAPGMMPPGGFGGPPRQGPGQSRGAAGAVAAGAAAAATAGGGAGYAGYYGGAQEEEYYSGGRGGWGYGGY